VKPAEVIAWFDEVAQSRPESWMQGPHVNERGAAWLASAASAIGLAFPAGHAIQQQWARAEAAGDGVDGLDRSNYARWMACGGVFASAHAQVQSGRLRSLVGTARAGAEDDVLEVAEELLADSLAAGAVLAGGALEAHLKHLCHSNADVRALLPQGHGSIEKYNLAIGQARNAGKVTLYEKPEQSQVTSWGQLRNEAAHDPAKFQKERTEPEVRLMIAGIRGFLTRVQ